MELVEPAQAKNDKVSVSRKALESVLQQCQSALQLLAVDNDDYKNDKVDVGQDSATKYAATDCDTDTVKFYGLLQSKFEGDDFLKKLENAQALIPQDVAEVQSYTCYLHDALESRSWEMVSRNDLWEGGSVEFEMEDYALVQQEDIVEGIATFMAAYLLSLEQTKDLTPNQLQKALRKIFSGEKKKSKLRKAWDGSRLIYNVASWGATAIGIYQNPALVNAASAVFRTSCHALSKLL